MQVLERDNKVFLNLNLNLNLCICLPVRATLVSEAFVMQLVHHNIVCPSTKNLLV